MRKLLEVCVNSIESALAAQAGGGDRIELCDNMHEGGTTPSYGMIKRCKELLSIPVFPIIRPRGGNFTYTEEEFFLMKEDILLAKELGCEGVVFGLLLADGTVDKERMATLVAIARPMQVTFHRAIDCTVDIHQALEDLIDLGVDRVLTSGGAVAAPLGIKAIASLHQQAAGRILVMAGAGITPETLEPFILHSWPDEVHSTAKALVDADGPILAGIPYSYNQTSSAIVRKLRGRL